MRPVRLCPAGVGGKMQGHRCSSGREAGEPRKAAGEVAQHAHPGGPHHGGAEPRECAPPALQLHCWRGPVAGDAVHRWRQPVRAAALTGHMLPLPYACVECKPPMWPPHMMPRL